MMFTTTQLSMLLATAAMLHVTEEFYFPGGFIEWYRELMPPKTTGRGPSFLVWINALSIWVIALALYYGDTPTGAAIFLGVATVLAINGCFHIWGVYKLRKYSPGVITGTLLYLPLYVYGGYDLVTSGLVSMQGAAIYLAAAVAYHFLSARRQAK